MAVCVRSELLEPVVDVYCESCEELLVVEGRHEARHQRHASAISDSARLQNLAQMGQHAVFATATVAF